MNFLVKQPFDGFLIPNSQMQHLLLCEFIYNGTFSWCLLRCCPPHRSFTEKCIKSGFSANYFSSESSFIIIGNEKLHCESYLDWMVLRVLKPGRTGLSVTTQPLPVHNLKIGIKSLDGSSPIFMCTCWFSETTPSLHYEAICTVCCCSVCYKPAKAREAQRQTQ